MNELQIFSNQEFGTIRTTEINGEPFFVGKDVAEALGYEKPRNAIAQHVDPDDALKQGLTDSLGREQEAIFISESGVYALVFSSKLPKAKEFKHWVTSEVLPTIRKHGAYATPATIWLKGLPALKTNSLPRPNNAELYGRRSDGKPINFAEGHGRLPKQQSWCSSISDSVLRSKTFPGVAKAMAEQWGDYLREEEEK